jgi:hypothetical protein
MTLDNLTTPVATAATTKVKLCLYDEEEPHIWFLLIKAQFSAAGIRSQKLKYANALANLPKQVLRDILDTLDVCNESDEPFDYLKNTLLGQFGKSKWQSYFELLRLPMETQGLKPRALVGKLKQHLPPVFLWTTIFFWSCFLFACHHLCVRQYEMATTCGHGEGCGCPVGCSRRPRHYGHSSHNSAK